ncbi:50S ribosomal protein L14e [Candidatus Norongarragalina meridionalis]|nr:50S ribosomal protein L14e [Candidatus Norongarragalina meridionalis]
MAAIKTGMKCVKTAGRHAGDKVEIVKLIDKNFVEVKDAKGKAKRCNVAHLEPC